MDLSTLTTFLRTAKAATYAGDGPKAPASRPGSEDYHYTDGDWVYHDCYWGARSFIGHEIVWVRDTPVWGMNYWGGPVDAAVGTDAAYAFLKTALKTASDPLPPVRGPALWTDGPYRYANTVTGTLASFTGTEDVLLNHRLVCRHVYHGGFISP